MVPSALDIFKQSFHPSHREFSDTSLFTFLPWFSLLGLTMLVIATAVVAAMVFVCTVSWCSFSCSSWCFLIKFFLGSGDSFSGGHFLNFLGVLITTKMDLFPRVHGIAISILWKLYLDINFKSPTVEFEMFNFPQVA